MDIMRPHMRGWMGVLLLRRAALVFCLLLGQRGGGIVHVPYFGNEIGWLGPPFFILLICVGAQGYCQPFATANDNILEMFCLLTLLTFVFSDTFFVGKRPPSASLSVHPGTSVHFACAERWCQSGIRSKPQVSMVSGWLCLVRSYVEQTEKT